MKHLLLAVPLCLLAGLRLRRLHLGHPKTLQTAFSFLRLRTRLLLIVPQHRRWKSSIQLSDILIQLPRQIRWT